jgi:hypothetical protein
LRLSRVCLITALALCVIGAPAQAAYPGKNGKLVLLSCNLYTINPDGTNQQQITFEPPCPGIEEPEWSPDGKRIAYTQAGDVFVINPDGSGNENVTQGAHGAAAAPSWSPDGTQIAYEALTTGPLGNETHIWVVNSDGTGGHRLDDMCSSYDPRWRPDGARIAFIGSTDPVEGGGGCDPGSIGRWLIHPDGTDRVPFEADDIHDWSPDGGRVVFYKGCFAGTCYGIWTQPADGSAPATNITAGPGFFPHWSPDGTRIAFRGRRPGDSAGFVYTVAPDGSDWQRVSTVFVTELSWQPIPVNAYPRPRAATPVEVSLVPSYSACTSPNRTHGPPLAFGSCAPPSPASDELTLGTPDANGKPAKGEGVVRYGTTYGDVRIEVELHDVYDTALAGYGGELRLRTSLRITDKRNTPHPGGPGAATVSDTTLEATVPCIGTASPTGGSSCLLSTTANALAPGTLSAGARSVWELGQVQVDDGGADGDADTAGDNTRFMVQGLFVP